MFKYALILPLIVASFLLGYFASNSQREQVYAIVIVTIGFVAVGYLFLVKHKKWGAEKRTKKIAATALITVFLFSAVIGTQFVRWAEANPVPVYSLTMPEEYINYTVCRVNGSLWAKVDGIYPLNKVDVECQRGMDDTGLVFSADTLTLVYPTPPGTTNISIKVDEIELKWSNYTQSVPEALHYTAVGDWPMISCTIYPIFDKLTLKIHYEHPIMLINGSNTFLYDLNLSPYLSQWSNKSAAHFNIRFETEITDIQAYTITTDGTLNHVDYTVTQDGDAKTMSLQVISEYSESLPGDLIISFTENKDPERTTRSFLDTSSRTELAYTIVAVTSVAVVVMLGYLFSRRKNRETKNKLANMT